MKPAVILFALVAGCSAPADSDAGATNTGGGAARDAGQTGGGAAGGGSALDAGSDAGMVTGRDAGERCTLSDDCASGECVTSYPGTPALCARRCATQGECSGLTGFFCEPGRDGGGLCIPNSPAHCLRCTTDDDCGALAETCVALPGELTPTCHVDCSLAGAAACPADYICTLYQLNGGWRSLCVPPTSCDSSAGGFCDRVPQPQACDTTNEAGTCTGNRTCMQGRFTACGAGVPQCKASCGQADRPGCTERLCPEATQLPDHCGDCATACPGAGSTTSTSTCTNSTCSLSCNAEQYDADGNTSNGCEVLDTPAGHHTLATAFGAGSNTCSDSDAFSASGVLPSDTRPHAPAIVGFDAVSGSAPDFLVVDATGGNLCLNNLSLTLAVSGAANLACYRLDVTTDKNTYSCTTGSNGNCTVNDGSGSYSDGSTITLVVSRTCAAAPANATWTLDGHF